MMKGTADKVKPILCESPHDLSSISFEDGGTPMGLSLADGEEETIAGSCTASEEEDTTPQPAARALMVQLSETNCRLTLQRNDGILIPLHNANKYSIPLYMALIRKKTFVFGTSVVEYANAAKKDPNFKKQFKFWNLGSQLLQPLDTYVWNNSQLFTYHGSVVEVKFELLFGLFINYLKKLVETKLNPAGNEEIRHMVFAVPLWFTSFHRQRLKDAARIAGFQDSTVINEISTLAVLHLSTKRLPPMTSMNLLVLSENSGNVDLAFYNSVAGVFVKMIACTGNMYDSVDNRNKPEYSDLMNLVKQKYESVKRMGKTAENDDNLKWKRLRFMEHLLRSLLLELRQKLHNGVIPADALDVLLLSGQPGWKPLLEEQLKSGVVTMYEHLGAPPVTADVNSWHPPIVSFESMCGNEESVDLIPYEIYSSWDVKLLEKDAVARDGTLIKSSACYPTTHLTVDQRNAQKQIFVVGSVKIKSSHYSQCSNIEIQIKFGRDGIFQLDSIYLQQSGRRKCKLEQGNEGYSWHPSNLLDTEIQKFSRELKWMSRLSDKYQDDVSNVREKLWNICQEMAEGLWLGTHTRRLLKKKKIAGEIKKKVDNILMLLQRSGINYPLVEMGEKDLDKLLKEVQTYKKYFSCSVLS